MQQLKDLGLSPSEIRVAMIIAQGKSAKQAAHIIGRKHETVRNQLKSVFMKTDTHRQSALAVLITRMEIQLAAHSRPEMIQ